MARGQRDLDAMVMQTEPTNGRKKANNNNKKRNTANSANNSDLWKITLIV